MRCELMRTDALSIIYDVTLTNVGYPITKMRRYYLSIIPYGQEAELQGFYSFCSIVFQFAPPIIAGEILGTRWSLGGILFFYVISVLVFITIDTDKARADAEDTKSAKLEAFKEASRRRSVGGGEAAVNPVDTTENL